jgi:hypothetical protein
MGRFGRKIQRKQGLSRGDTFVDYKILKKAGFSMVPDTDPRLIALPPLASQLEAMASPVLAMYPNEPEEMLQPILAFVVLSWNLGFMARFAPEQTAVDRLLEKNLGPILAQEPPAERDRMFGLCRSLVKMRQEFFGHDPRIIENFSVRRQGTELVFGASGVAALRLG